MFLCKNFSQKCARLAALFSLLAAFSVAAQAQVVFSPPKNISNSSGNTQGQQILVDSRGNINVVWSDNSSGSYAILFSRSTDGGAAFSTPVNVSSHPGSAAIGARMALDAAGNIYIGWTDNSPGQNAAFFSRSVDGGATFSSPLLISNPGALGGLGGLAVDSTGNVDVVWGDNSTGISSVFFSRSMDGGASFSSPVDLSNRSPQGQAFAPSLAVGSQGNIYVAWIGLSQFVSSNPFVLFSHSTDGGATFSALEFMGGGILYQFPDSLQVAANSPSNVTVVWGTDNGTPDFTVPFYSLRNSSDGGATFGPLVQVNGCRAVNGFAYHPMLPAMALDSLGGANILSHNSCDGSTGSVNFARYVGTGIAASTSWSASGSDPAAKALAVDSSNNIDVVFAGGTSGTPGPGFWFAESTDQGATFSLTQPISLSTAISNPEIATGGGNIYVVWEQTDSSGNANLFFSSGTALSLASVSLSITSVTGGSSSTGTVTLSAPAPTGGAVVTLSSSDPSVSVPATVTVAEGATSATFAVTTSPVATATTAAVSAVLSGVTQTASITVEPPVLTSLTLNPSSTMGGSSSTGTLTLSGPAPAGGSVVALSSSNTSVASVVSSVTVAPGSTNATFTMSTSRQLCPNSATITASFSGVTFTGNLAVQPFVTLPSQACAAIGAHGGGPGQ